MIGSSGKKRAKLVDVAKLAGVSPGTVSNTLHNTRFVEPETRRRVEDAIRTLGYVPDIRARQLRTGKTQTIALLSSVPMNIASGASRLGFMMEIALSAAIIALEKQHALVLIPPGEQLLDSVSVDAAILLEPSRNDPLIAQLQNASIPFVTIGKAPGEEVYPWVDLQSAVTTSMLLEHLEAQGARRIALFTGRTERTSSHQAEAVYRHWCGSHASPVIMQLDEMNGEEAGYLAMKQCLSQHHDIDGVLVLIDTFATGVLKALREEEIAVPHQMRVATRYDGIRAREATPAMTAVNLHLDLVAQAAVHLLFDLLAGKPATSHPGYRPELVVRQSTSVSPAGND